MVAASAPAPGPAHDRSRAASGSAAAATSAAARRSATARSNRLCTPRRGGVNGPPTSSCKVLAAGQAFPHWSTPRP
eukprot:4976635-Alexandrium_andersonii.AAC.1